MAVYKRGGTWWYEFIFAGKRVRESAKTSRKTIALEAERQKRLELERAMAGMPTDAPVNRIRSIADAVETYLRHYPADHSEKATVWSKGCLAHVRKELGGLLLPDVTENRIRQYIVKRRHEGASNRTINMEIGELSRAIGRTWRECWPRLQKLQERADVGRALSSAEEADLLKAAAEISKNKAPLIGVLVRLALSTGMRAGELISLTWRQVDLNDGLLTVGRAKTVAGTGRVIPMNSDVQAILVTHRDWFATKFGQPEQGHYVFPFGSPIPKDPTRPTVEIKTAWNSIRKAAGVDCRWHDLRHTAATKMAEAGIPESTMLALMGHMSRKMLERYSHIRLKAKRDAVEALKLRTEVPTVAARPAISGRVPTKVPTLATPTPMRRVVNG